MDMFPLWLSLRVALTATALTLVIGIPVALLLARRRFPGKNVLEAAVVLPLVLPPTVLGYYLLLVIGSRGPVGRALAALGLELAFTWGAAVLAACVGSIALVIKSAQAGFEGVDRQLEQAARTLGRSEWSVFWSVTLPLAWRAVLAGGVLAFCRALGEFGITLMVAGNIPGRTQTLPLQCLAGLIRPDAGRIVVGDRVFFDADASIALSPQARRIGYVFQGYALFPHLTVEENVGFGLRDRSRVERARRSAEVIERLGLVGLARRYPRELSGGQRQRVALGRALAIDPALLLLDEPLSALDAPLRRTLRDELRETLTGWGTPAVVVTHDFTEAYRLADRIVVYESGRVIQSAPRAELLWQPASEAVARIMGLRNVLRGTVVMATPERIQIGWRGQTLEAVNSPTRSYLPPPDSPIAFFIRS